MSRIQALKICLLTAILSSHLKQALGANDPVPENYANVTTTCGTEAMTVLVEVEADFDGNIYPDGFPNDDTCTSYVAYSNTMYEGYELEYHYTDLECGQTWEEKENGIHEFSAVTYIQFDYDLIQSTDKRHRSTCTFDSEQQVSIRTGRVSDAGTDESNDTVSGILPTFTIVDVDNIPLQHDDVVVVGDELELKIALITNPTFTDMIVSDCLASSTDPPKSSDNEKLKLIENDGCPADTTVLAGVPSYLSWEAEGQVFYRVPIYAFIFSDSVSGDEPNYLYFTCKVFLCSTSASCAKPTCAARERRSADERRASYPDTDHTRQLVRTRRAEGGQRSTVGGSVQVRAAGHSGRQNQGASQQGEQGESYAQCVNSPTGQSLLAVLVIFVLALITTIVALTVLNCRLRRRLQKLCKRGEEGRVVGVDTLHGHKHRQF